MSGSDDGTKPQADDGWGDWDDSTDEGSTGPETPPSDDASATSADDGWGDWSGDSAGADDAKPSADDSRDDGMSGSDDGTKSQADDGWDDWGDDGMEEAAADDGWGDSATEDKTAPATAKPSPGGFHSNWRDRMGDDDAGEGVFDWDDEPDEDQGPEAADKAPSDGGEPDGTGDDPKDVADGGWDDWDSEDPETDDEADRSEDDAPKDATDGGWDDWDSEEPKGGPGGKADDGNPPVSDWERDGERDAARPLPIKPILIAVSAAILVVACVLGVLQYRRAEAHKAAVTAHTAACRTLESDAAEYRHLRHELADLKIEVDEPKTPDCSKSTTAALDKADKALGVKALTKRLADAATAAWRRDGKAAIDKAVTASPDASKSTLDAMKALADRTPKDARDRKALDAELKSLSGKAAAEQKKADEKKAAEKAKADKEAADKAAAEKAKADEEARKAAEEQARRQAEAQAQAQSQQQTQRRYAPSYTPQRTYTPQRQTQRQQTTTPTPAPTPAPAQNQGNTGAEM